MWKLEFEITEHDYDERGKIIKTTTKKTILYLPESALVFNQPLPPVQSAEQYVAEEAARNERIVKLLRVLTARLHHLTFSDAAENQESTTAEFFLHAFVLENEKKMFGIAHIYDRHQRKYRFIPTVLNGFIEDKSSLYVNAYENMKITKLNDNGLHEILASNEQPNDEELKNWFSSLSSNTNLLCPAQHVQYFEHKIKHNFIAALYNAAIDYYQTILPLLACNEHEAFLTKVRSFNYKFKGIARIQDNLGMTSFSDTLHHLQNHVLRDEDNNRSLEFFIDELLKRCAQHEEWLNDGGRAYTLCIKHLQGLPLTLEVPEPLFNLSIAENLPEMMRKVVFTGYKDTFAAPFQYMGVIDERSRFAFTEFAIDASTQLDDSLFIDVPISRDNTGKQVMGSTDKMEEVIVARVYQPGSVLPEVKLTLLQKLARFMASDAFKRVMIGIGIGVGVGVLAALFVTITLFSGGTFIPAAAAAAALATIGGTAGAIGTMSAGVALTTFIGGLLGWCVHKKIQKPDKMMLMPNSRPSAFKANFSSSAFVANNLTSGDKKPVFLPEQKTAPAIPGRLTGKNIDSLLDFLDEDSEKDEEEIIDFASPLQKRMG